MKRILIFFVAGATLLANRGDAQTAAVMSDQAAARFLDQATWGPTPASIAQLQQTGVIAWLNAQFALNTSDLPDQPLLGSDGKANRDLTPVQAAFFQNAVTGQDQLRQRVAFALSQMWVVSAVSTKFAYAFPPYWRLFRDNAFANYRDIMKALTLSPAMGNYLNMANNNKGNPVKGTAANENYARELMQLFTVGLTQLDLNGNPVLDSNNNPVPTYDQSVVTNTARALTGWTYPTAPNTSAKANNPQYYLGQMFAVEGAHDTTSKTIIGGATIPAGQTAAQDLEAVLDALMAQRSMAPFVSRQLIQHLVTSDPSPAYIQRVSNVFLNNGSGVRGDMRAVITAILTDQEARAGDDASAAANATFGHLREPVLFLANILRGLNATLGPSSAIDRYSAELGEDLFYPPTVFSYFSPMYTLESGEPAPEFQIYSAQTAAYRADIVNTILYGALDKSTAISLTPFLPAGNDLSAMADTISHAFLHHAMSSDLRSAALSAASAATGAKAQAQAALYVVLTSSEYQIVQ
ncbi:MAG: DUF1800 domain-containing protein [Candidatus Sulfopaludibacter sp.]|nr:DUF1800 domain-containing protein [Candidatus Sulfopaludibacter sp.]